MKKIYITGISGTGKSAIAEKLNKRGIYAIDIDEVEGLCRWRNKKTFEKADWYSGIGNEFFESHRYVCDKNKLFSLMNKNKDIIVVVGVADNQADFLDSFDKVFLLHCSEKTFLKRIKDRTNHDFGKHKTEQKMILSWYKSFEKEMLDKGAVPINTEDSIETVVNNIISKI